MCDKSTTEFEIEVSNGHVRIIAECLPLKDGRYTVVTKSTALKEKQEDVFVKVEASKLSYDDEFMNHQPRTKRERRLKKNINYIIQHELKDFWRPKYDPSFNEDRTGICYEAGKSPAVGMDYIWWAKVASKFCPERRSRLGTLYEYVAFLAVLIKKLVESGWSVSNAWRAVCDDSKKLGHYWNSENAKHEFEDAGCREICGFFDLANTNKLLATGEFDDVCCLAGGFYNSSGNTSPLASLHLYNRQLFEDPFTVGWIVLEEDSTDPL